MDVQQIISYILANYGLLTVIISVLVTIVLQLIKTPLKKLTAKIKNDRLRKLVNKLFILISYGIAFGIYYIGRSWIPTLFSNINIAEYAPIAASFSIVIYALFEGIITKKKAKDILEDGNISKDEIIDIVKSSKNNQTNPNVTIVTKKAKEKAAKEKSVNEKLQDELDKI